MKHRSGGLRAWLSASVAVLALVGCGGGGGGGEASTVTPAPAAPTAAPAAPSPPAAALAQSALRFAIGTTADGSALEISAFLPADGSFRRLRGYTAASLGVASIGLTSIDPTGRFLYRFGDTGPVMHRLTVDGIVNTAGRTATQGRFASTPAFTPDGAFVYAWSEDDQLARLRAYAITSEGLWTELPGSPFATTDRTSTGALQVHPSGRFLVRGAPSYTSGPLTGYTIEANGALKPIPSTPPSLANTTGPVVFAGTARLWVQRPDGWFLFSVGQDGTLAVLTTNPTFPSGTTLVADASGKWLVVATPESNFEFAQLQLHAFEEGSNRLTRVGAPVRGYASSLVADPVGELFRSRDLVLRPDANRGLLVGAISPETGLAVLGTASSDPISFMYALDADAGLVRVLKTDPATGALTQVSGGAATMVGRPVALTVSPRGEFVAVVARDGADAGVMRIFRIGGTGNLLAGFTAAIPVGPQPTAVAMSADGRHIYVSHANGIDAFAFEPTGVVRKLAGSPFATGFAGIAGRYDPVQQRIVYDLPDVPEPGHPAADLLQAGGVLFAATNAGAEGDVSTLGTSPDGTLFGIHTGRAACAVGAPATGSTFSPSGTGTLFLGSAGKGRLVYALNSESGTIAGFRAVGGACVQTEGWMPAITGSPFAIGARPTAMVVDPSGRYLYAAHPGSVAGQVSVFTVSPISGTLSRVGGSPFPLAMVPQRMWMDLAGKFLYTSDAAGNVDVLTVDRGTGAPGPARSTLIGLRAHIARDVLVTVR
ncbi:MAG TPA: beta-propeller fold lactonase family protein [Ramlibacter sp.]|nr:beta-propeller fold lactonase family protein [Ramlibacter sp.]